MSVKPQKTRTQAEKESMQQKIQRITIEYGDNPRELLAQMKKLTRELEGEVTKQELKDIWGTSKRYKLDDIREARKWFSDELKRLNADPREVQHKQMSKYTKRQQAISVPTAQDIGKMFFYKYDPKTKADLPYYDTFPLILMVKPLKDGWQGLNLHYLPPAQRAVLIKRLMENLSDTKMDNNTRLRINYNLLKAVTKYRYFKPCFKRYLFPHIRSTVRPVPIRHWAKAILLPVAQFKKASQATVWSDSKRISRGV